MSSSSQVSRDTPHWEKVRKLARLKGHRSRLCSCGKCCGKTQCILIVWLVFLGVGQSVFPFIPLWIGFSLVCALHLPVQKGTVMCFSQKSFSSSKTSEQTSVCCCVYYLEAAWEQNSSENVTHQAVYFRPLLDPVNNCSSQVAQFFCWSLLICSNMLLSCFLLL